MNHVYGAFSYFSSNSSKKLNDTDDDEKIHPVQNKERGTVCITALPKKDPLSSFDSIVKKHHPAYLHRTIIEDYDGTSYTYFSEKYPYPDSDTSLSDWNPLKYYLPESIEDIDNPISMHSRYIKTFTPKTESDFDDFIRYLLISRYLGFIKIVIHECDFSGIRNSEKSNNNQVTISDLKINQKIEIILSMIKKQKKGYIAIEGFPLKEK